MQIKNIFKENHPILANEFKKTFPIYFLGMLANGVQATFHFINPFIIGQILDLLLQETISTQEIMNKVYLLIIASILALFPRAAYRWLFFTRARISDTKLRKEALKHLQYVKPEYYEKEEKSAFLAYLSKELLAIRKFLGNFFYNIGRLILNPLVVLVIIAVKYNILISASVIPILAIMSILIFKKYKKLKEKLEIARKLDIELFKISDQNTAGFSLIKLYNEQDNQIKKFKKLNEEISNAYYKVGIVKNQISNYTNIIYAACYIAVFGISLILVQNGGLTVGALTALTICISFVISEVTQSIQPLIEGLAYYKQSTRRYNYLLSLDTYNTEGENLKEIEKITIKNLSYSYDGINNVLKNINMEIKKGEKIGIIGQIGSGKTTLMNILSGFLEIPNNTIYINDIDINKYKKSELFKAISYTTQSPIILDDTIENNINIANNPELNLENLTSLSELSSDIKEMEKGLKTVIGERGTRLSGGQKQRVQIARSISSLRDVNIFDDTLSALDIQTEEKVLEAIIDQTKGRNLIIISNKISSMEKLDKVYLLIDGEIQAERYTRRTIRKK
ncbi:MAG: ABC transporter ATP-binding protein [Clostridia bacterium]|nr:ABC transporter ATP-binding protein [Clostridia bacterium]